MGGATIVSRSLKTKQKKIFKIGPIFFISKSIHDPFIFANHRCSKIRSIHSDRDVFMCQSWAKMSNFIPHSIRLSGIIVSPPNSGLIQNFFPELEVSTLQGPERIWTCLHYRGMCCSWRCLQYRGLSCIWTCLQYCTEECTAPGGVCHRA